MLTIIKNNTRCPVCDFQTSDKICPYSISGSYNNKGIIEHQTYDDIYSSFDTNPYWDEVDGKLGFRLGWTDSELQNIFENASKILNKKSRLTSSPITPKESVSSVFITPEHVYGLTEEEVLSICMLKIYNSIEFPKDEPTVDKGYGMFSYYSIPSKYQTEILETFGMLRNLYTIIIRGRRNPKYKKFRIGIMRLLLRWSIPDYFDNFKKISKTMNTALEVKPNIKKYGAISGFKDVSKLSDSERRKLYRQTQTSLGQKGFEMVFSQLYYHELPKHNGITKKRIWFDILWLMEEYDRVDFFGFPGFVFKHENRIERIMFVLSIASLRASEQEKDSLDFIKKKNVLSSVISPYIGITRDVWSSGNEDLWVRNDIINNNTIHDEYSSAVIRLAKDGIYWMMEEKRLIELFRRVCGYSGKPKFKSIVDGKFIEDKDVKSLQAGYDENGNTVNMLNFKKAVSLIAPYIKEPSPVPYQTRPRYGLLLCESCNDLHYIDNDEFEKGCFDVIDPENGMPKDQPFNKIILKYKCKKCDAEGCREISVSLNKKCKRCAKDGSVISYLFARDHMSYNIRCESCGINEYKKEYYDNEKSQVLFDGNQGDITNTGISGTHGDLIFRLTSRSDSAIIKNIEHPVNLKSTLETPDASAEQPCPYEITESDEKRDKDICCQNMPGEWSIENGSPPQFEISRVVKGKHKTKLVESLKMDDGVTIDRYVCMDHMSIIKNMMHNLEKAPDKNPSKIIRGSIDLSSVYIDNKKRSINDKNIKLHKNRIETTDKIMDIPLSISDIPGIANTDQDLLDTMRYYRSVENPNTPVAEISGKQKPPEGMEYTQYKDSNKLGIDTRHFFSFDIKKPSEPAPEISCDEICREWERLDLIRATMPFERYPKTYKMQLQKTQIRQWQISHGPSKLVPALSMPFIPTVTPKERVKLKWGLEKEVADIGLVAVHIDQSGSMDSTAWKMACPYILSREECDNCGTDYIWRDDKCVKYMDRIEAAKRLLIGTIMDAKERGDKLMVYGFHSHYELLNPPEFIIDHREIPVDDYEKLLNYYLFTPIQSQGMTRPEKSLNKMLSDLKDQRIDKMTTIILTDGEFSIYTNAWYDILQNYGPIFIYQIGDGNVEKLRKDLLSTLISFGWSEDTDYNFEITKVDVDDGGIALIKDVTSDINKSQRS